MRRIFALFLLTGTILAGVAAGAAELEKLLDKRGEIWKQPR